MRINLTKGAHMKGKSKSKRVASQKVKPEVTQQDRLAEIVKTAHACLIIYQQTPESGISFAGSNLSAPNGVIYTEVTKASLLKQMMQSN
jgi:hypothetical protein